MDKSSEPERLIGGSMFYGLGRSSFFFKNSCEVIQRVSQVDSSSEPTYHFAVTKSIRERLENSHKKESRGSLETIAVVLAVIELEP